MATEYVFSRNKVGFILLNGTTVYEKIKIHSNARSREIPCFFCFIKDYLDS